MQTSGRPGCHYTHLENAYLLRIAAPRELSTVFDPHSRKIHRVDLEVRAGHCRCCSGGLDESGPVALPAGVVATDAMENGFMMKQPLCRGCATGVAQIMVDVCAEPGGMKGGSVTDKICSRSNFVVERQAATTLFDGQTEERRKNAAAHFRELVAAQADVPSLEGAKVKITPIQKVSLISCARPLVTTAPPSARGACLMAADQAPLRARSMRLRSSHIFNGVTQNCHATSFHAP